MIHVIFGGQYGSEGKGAFCAYQARQKGYRAAVRGGGPQAGHTFYDERFGGRCVVRQIPVAAVVNRSTIGYIGPGAVIDLETLQHEHHQFGMQDNLRIHPNACIVEITHREREQDLVAGGNIPGSTKEGVGAARAGRALRMAMTVGEFVQHSGGWMRDVVDTSLRVYDRILHWAASVEDLVMAEGAQGFGLSLWQGQYPYVTSADTTPAAILSECGLPVWGVERTIAVLRTYPIRVGGPSGPLPGEISWSDIGQEPETTTVTGRQRRIAKFDWEQFERMVRVCRPTHVALMFADYMDPEIRTKPLGNANRDLLDLWSRINRRVSTPWLGVGGERFEVRGAMDGMFMTALSEATDGPSA